MFSISELRRREVIDATTAEKLGVISDLEIDLKTGLIQSIIVPKRRIIARLFSANREYVIPWQNILAIGNEIILVNTTGLSNTLPKDKSWNGS